MDNFEIYVAPYDCYMDREDYEGYLGDTRIRLANEYRLTSEALRALQSIEPAMSDLLQELTRMHSGLKKSALESEAVRACGAYADALALAYQRADKAAKAVLDHEDVYQAYWATLK